VTAVLLQLFPRTFLLIAVFAFAVPAAPPYSGGEPKARCAGNNSAAICFGVSMCRLGKEPAVITIRNGAD